MSKNDSDSFEVKSRSSANAYLRAAELQVSPIRGIDFSGMSRADKIALLQQILKRKIHGISFSPYLDCQSPGIHIGEQQIRDSGEQQVPARLPR